MLEETPSTLVLDCTLSGAVQALFSKEKMAAARQGEHGLRAAWIARVSSSCS